MSFKRSLRHSKISALSDAGLNKAKSELINDNNKRPKLAKSSNDIITQFNKMKQ